MSALKFLKGRATSVVNVEDVFSSFTYTGTGASLGIVNGINLSTKGGMVWAKCRSNADYNCLADTANGVNKYTISDQTFAQQSETSLTAFNSNGFTLGNWASANTNARTYVGWSFAKQAKFFHTESAVKSAGSNKTVDLSTLGTVGMVAVKRTDAVGSWYVWHRSLTAGKLLYLEQTAAEATLGHITVSGTTLTLVDGVIADGTYIVYAWAHDTSSTGLIQCGTFTTDGSGNYSVTLGWEPQFLITKNNTTTSGWRIVDTSRGMTVSGTQSGLLANTSGAEAGTNAGRPFATGFSGGAADASEVILYLAIRRGPMALPTVGTQVYNAIARSGNDILTNITGVGFPPDLVVERPKIAGYVGGQFFDRLRGKGKALFSNTTNAENSTTDSLTAFGMDGITVWDDVTNGYINTTAASPFINWFFRRYPGVFDEVCYTGTGSNLTVAHNLGVVPEMMIFKSRDTVGHWDVYHAAIGNQARIYLALTNAVSGNSVTYWNNTTPTATSFYLGTAAPPNDATNNVAYLFATLAGISKVGTYTGNGSNQTINCGFAAGARFVLIKATSTTGNWVVFDSVRGIVAGNDPYLLLNSTAAEDTDEDAVDTDNSGFIVNETTAANVNTNGVTYIYLAFS